MYRPCELKDQTYKKTRTLHFSDYSEPDFSIRETKMDHFGLKMVHFGPFRSANHTLAIPDVWFAGTAPDIHDRHIMMEGGVVCMVFHRERGMPSLQEHRPEDCKVLIF